MASDHFGPNSPYHRFVDRQHPDGYRQTEIQALRRAILAKENRLVLGMPDIGLSNLLRFLVTRTDWDNRKVTFAYVGCHALDDCLHFQKFFEDVARQFHEQYHGSVLNETVRGYERLKRFLQEIGGDPLNRLVVVVNKTEQLLQSADEAFFRRLKALTDLNKRLCYVFAADLSVAETIGAKDVLFAGRRLIVGPFTGKDTAGAIVEEGQRLDTTFSRSERNKLTYLTGGHPGLLRAVSTAIVEEKLNLLETDTALVKQLLAREAVEGRCEGILSVLNPKRRRVLLAVASEKPGPRDQDELTWLQDFGFIAEQNGKYQLFSPILSEFVSNQSRIKPKDIVIVDGKVFRGEEEIHLRPRVYRLLTLLMTEPGRVFSHDEIALGVWESYEVTPNMITNIIAELRKKLGKDCIKTHPGRGYEFVTPC